MSQNEKEGHNRGWETYIWSGKQDWTEECPETFRCHPIRVGVLQRPREYFKEPVE